MVSIGWLGIDEYPKSKSGREVMVSIGWLGIDEYPKSKSRR